MKPFAVGLVLLAASAVTNAETATLPARPDPRDARMAAPLSTYASPFARYRPFAVQPPGPWREVNDQVGRIGGWKVYAREAQEPVTPKSTPEAAVPGAAPLAPAKPGPR